MLFPMLNFRPKAKPQSEVNHSRIDRLTYAIGDIHGRFDLFTRMLDFIKSESGGLGEKPRIVLLGDYIDRGPSSAEVLARIIELKQEPWCDVVVLLGNHELFLMNFVVGGGNAGAWLEYGGSATLSSYGIAIPKDGNDPEQWQAAMEEVLRVVPRDHMLLLCDAKIYLIAQDYLFVHGGVRPGVPIEDQGSETMLWIREEFLSSKKACDYVVVHGHSAQEAADNLPWRIGVDTGAYATGVLTAVRLWDDDREIIQVTQNGHKILLTA